MLAFKLRPVGCVVNLLAPLLLCTPAALAEWHDTAIIAAAAVDHARGLVTAHHGDVEVVARTIDPRLRLHRCDQALETYLPPGSNIANGGVVGVRCPAPVAWKIFVPVTVERRAMVARATRSLPAGHQLLAGDIEWVRRTLRSHDAVLIKGVDNPVGQLLRQPSAGGQVIRANMLRPALAIRRGERVTLAVSDAALRIRMYGKALSDGALGQRVRARNDSSGRIVEGIVKGQGLVEISIY